MGLHSVLVMGLHSVLVMGLHIDVCPAEKKNLGIWLHSVTICILANPSQAVIRRTNNLVLFQKAGWCTDSLKSASRFYSKNDGSTPKLGRPLCAQNLFREDDSVRISSIPSQECDIPENQPILDPY
jgi:hypothetical protein